MRFSLLLVLTAALFTVQTSLPPSAGWPGRPDLLLVLVFGWGLVLGPPQAVAALGLAGVLSEAASAAPPGTQLLALAPAAALSILRRAEIMEHPVLLGVVLMPLVTLASYGITAVVLLATGMGGGSLDGLVDQWLPGLAGNVVLTPLMHTAITFLAEVLGLTRSGIGTVRRVVRE